MIIGVQLEGANQPRSGVHEARSHHRGKVNRYFDSIEVEKKKSYACCRSSSHTYQNFSFQNGNGVFTLKLHIAQIRKPKEQCLIAHTIAASEPADEFIINQIYLANIGYVLRYKVSGHKELCRK